MKRSFLLIFICIFAMFSFGCDNSKRVGPVIDDIQLGMTIEEANKIVENKNLKIDTIPSRDNVYIVYSGQKPSTDKEFVRNGYYAFSVDAEKTIDKILFYPIIFKEQCRSEEKFNEFIPVLEKKYDMKLTTSVDKGSIDYTYINTKDKWSFKISRVHLIGIITAELKKI